jgi:chromosome segregation ATPase
LLDGVHFRWVTRDDGIIDWHIPHKQGAVMGVLDQLIGKIRGKRRERFASFIEQYESAVEQLAMGEQVDVDELAELLDSLDKSDDDLRGDVDRKQRRMEAASQLERRGEVQRLIPALEATVKRLDDELTEIINSKRPGIAEAWQQVRDAQNELAALDGCENVLRTVGVPSHILRRQQELKGKESELLGLRAEYRQRTDEVVRRISQLQTNERNLREILQGTSFSDDKKKKLKPELDATIAELDQRRNALEIWDDLKAKIDVMAAEVATEHAEIERLILRP